LRFREPNLEWFNFVIKSRKTVLYDDVYDVIIGPAANDDVYETIRLFERGAYEEEAIKRLKVKQLFSQTLFKTDAALALLKFVKSTTIR